MDETVLPPRDGPSLRIARFTVENFRAITRPVTLSFGASEQAGDSIVVFHGANGAGKSTALLALALALRLARDWGRNSGHIDRWSDSGGPQQEVRLGRGGIVPRDFAEKHAPMRLRIEFEDPRMGACLFTIDSPMHGRLSLGIEVERALDVDGPQFQHWLNTPYGAHSRTFDAIDSRRYASWVRAQNSGSLVQPDFAEALFALRISREPRKRESWRFFTEVLQRFDTLHGKLVSIDRIDKNAAPELTFEERGRLVLGLEDLSSGEQQIVALVAAVLLSDAAILAIEEPELNLDAENQTRVRGILEELVKRGFKDQIFLESHALSFDGPGVVRFERGEQGVRAERVASNDRTTALAKGSGALPEFVSREGYTLLPKKMREELRLTSGGALWFLRGDRAWEAWREDDLARLLGDDEHDAGE
jgi:energy-coupling factor transporter ATP-binding protein EcfA2